MEDNIDDILENVSNNFFSQFPNSNNVPRTSTTNNRNRTNQQSNVNPSPSMRYVNRQLDTIYETMINYNTNMLQYQANIREMLRLMNVNSTNYQLRMNESRQMHQNRNSFRHFTNTTTQRQNGNNSFIFSQWTQPLFNQTRPRILSQTQINQYTTTFTYSDQSQEHVNETRCPISLENFQNGDSLCQIIGCGHVFLRTNLMNWFRRSHQCPICRYDLMNNRPQENTGTNETNPQQNADTNQNNPQQQNTGTNQNNPQQQNTGTNIQQNLEQEMYNLMQSFIDASISGLSSNYDISVNSIPLNDMSRLSSIFIPNDISNNVPNDVSNNVPNDVSSNVPNDVSNNVPNDVSNNSPDDEIEGDLSVD